MVNNGVNPHPRREISLDELEQELEQDGGFYDVKTRAIKVIIDKELKDQQLQDIVTYQINDALTDLQFTFISKILIYRQSKPITFNTPKSWKDRFKFDRQDKWFMKRWIKSHPIKWKKDRLFIEKHTVFPEVQVPLRNKRFLNSIEEYHYTFTSGFDVSDQSKKDLTQEGNKNQLGYYTPKISFLEGQIRTLREIERKIIKERVNHIGNLYNYIIKKKVRLLTKKQQLYKRGEEK